MESVTALKRSDADKKAEFLSTPIKHFDVTSFDARPLVEAMGGMSFTSRETARAAQIFNQMLRDPGCCSILTLAGSTSAAGCMQVYADMVRFGMVDAIVSTGASIVDMDFFEALGFKHYQGSIHADDGELRDHFVDRIYDTYIDEDELQRCDRTIGRIADTLDPKPHSSRAFIHEMGRWLKSNAKKKGSLVETAYDHGVPIFVPAFTDCSAGFGLVQHQLRNKGNHLTIDSVADFREMAEIMVETKSTGLTMIGGGVPKNFAQDVVLCTEELGVEPEMHKYAVQITVADVRDGACSSSTLREASSWGKVDTRHEQMVYAEATTVIPLIVSDAYHRGSWKDRKSRRYADLFTG